MTCTTSAVGASWKLKVLAGPRTAPAPPDGGASSRSLPRMTTGSAATGVALARAGPAGAAATTGATGNDAADTGTAAAGTGDAATSVTGADSGVAQATSCPSRETKRSERKVLGRSMGRNEKEGDAGTRVRSSWLQPVAAEQGRRRSGWRTGGTRAFIGTPFWRAQDGSAASLWLRQRRAAKRHRQRRRRPGARQ